MKKMMLLAGLLCICGLGYAVEDSFNAHVKVIKPVSIKVDEVLEFGEVVAGSSSVRTPNPVHVIIEGEAGKNVEIEYLMAEKHMTTNKIELKTKDGENKIIANLLNEDNGSALPASGIENTTFGSDGKIEKDIYGMITTISLDTKSGDYYSDDITIRVKYN